MIYKVFSDVWPCWSIDETMKDYEGLVKTGKKTLIQLLVEKPENERSILFESLDADGAVFGLLNAYLENRWPNCPVCGGHRLLSRLDDDEGSIREHIDAGMNCDDCGWVYNPYAYTYRSKSNLSTRQLGKFTISRRSLFDNSEFVADALALLKVIVVRSESVFYNDSIECVAISPAFAEVEPGVEPPEYCLVYGSDENGVIDYAEFTKK